MKKKILSVLLAFAVLLSMSACASDVPAESNVTSDTHIVVDHAGEEVELPTNIQRVVVCDILPLSSVLSVFFDSADKIVGMSDRAMAAAENSLLSELYPEILNAETGFISGSEVNLEELMLLEPDVVFYSESSVELGAKLRNAGFAAVAVSVNNWEYNSIETLKNWVSLLSEIFPENDRYQAVDSYSNNIYNLVQSRVKDIPEEERARVFFLYQYSESAMMTSGKLFFGEYWAEASGAVNVAQELTSDNSVNVGMEQVLAWNPEIIFITNFTAAQPDDIYNNSIGNYDWNGVEAAQNRRVYKMPLGMYRSYTPGADTPVTLLWLAKTIYPNIFADINITEETVKYYDEVFGITLTSEQAEQIFAPLSVVGDVYSNSN